MVFAVQPESESAYTFIHEIRVLKNSLTTAVHFKNPLTIAMQFKHPNAKVLQRCIDIPPRLSMPDWIGSGAAMQPSVVAKVTEDCAWAR